VTARGTPAGVHPSFAGTQIAASPRLRSAAGTHRLLAGSLQIAATGCGTLVFKEARAMASGHKPTWEDQSVRNVAFSIMLGALALLQIAVVAGELSHSGAQTAAAGNREAAARVVVAANESAHKTPAF
jgi:hypothetical protein